ncbi:MAG: hypothetical protein GY950_32340, partial [bacterium]|nr:hypothetical protein [bacterium]
AKKKKKRKKKKKKDENVFVLTNFFSYYPFLMPATFLSRQNQEKYQYQLLAEEKIGETNTFKLNVEPKKEAKGMRGIVNHGVVWIDAKDGSVVKIELAPRALRGIETLQAVARSKGTRMKVNDIHWYEVKRDKLRFPSKTEISEIRLALKKDDPKQMEEVENSKTVFNYKNYRFFNVNVDVVDSEHK